MEMVLDAKLTNDPNQIIMIFKEKGSGLGLEFSEVSRVVTEFFTNKNTVLRLVLSKDVVNKSKRKGSVTLYQFYINMKLEERLVHLVWKSDKEIVHLKEEEKVTVFANKPPKDKLPLDQYIIHAYLLKQKQKEEAALKAKANKQKEKDTKYKKEVLAAVFGEQFKAETLKKDDDPTKAITLKKRPDYTVPKDKWKLGNELKELQKKFPHDRCLQRMIQEEFKSNQLFQYPEEYDIFDKALEHSLKKNFTAGPKDMNDRTQNWKVPNFENESRVISEFNKKDM